MILSLVPLHRGHNKERPGPLHDRLHFRVQVVEGRAERGVGQAFDDDISAGFSSAKMSKKGAHCGGRTRSRRRIRLVDDGSRIDE